MRNQRRGLRSVIFNWKNLLLVFFLMGFGFFLYMYYATNVAKKETEDDLIHHRVGYQDCLLTVSEWKTKHKLLEKKNGQTEDELTRCAKDAKSLSGKGVHLESLVSEKDSTISLLEDNQRKQVTELENLRAQIDTLQTDLAAKDTELSNLQKKVDKLELEKTESSDTKTTNEQQDQEQQDQENLEVPSDE